MSNLFFGGLGIIDMIGGTLSVSSRLARLRCPQIQPAEVVPDPADHLRPWNRCADLPVATVGHPVPAACRQPLHRPIAPVFVGYFLVQALEKRFYKSALLKTLSC